MTQMNRVGLSLVFVAMQGRTILGELSGVADVLLSFFALIMFCVGLVLFIVTDK